MSKNQAKSITTKGGASTSLASSSLPSIKNCSPSEFVSAASAIKMEPEVSLSKFEDLLKKRKAEKLLESSSDFSTKETEFGTSVIEQPVKKANLSILDKKVQDAEAAAAVENSSGSNVSSSLSTPPRTNQPQKTIVQYSVYYVEGDDQNEEVPVCITICNIFGLKDQILGNKRMANGDMFYWPARMLYANQVATTMEAVGGIHPESAEFLTTSNGRPLIVLSRLSKVKKDALLTFDEINEFLTTYIQGREDDGSKSSPKKIFDLNIEKRALSVPELDALVAISAKIGAPSPSQK
jgi:hypothetical protein